MLHTDIPHESPGDDVHLGIAGRNIRREHAHRVPSGYDGLVYIRLHGSPRIYYSAYSAEWLEGVARIVEEKAARGISTWCIFDNTALGAATADALAVRSHLLDSQRVTG
jgi:uncharacterized protein YecE (DUF72 family)